MDARARENGGLLRIGEHFVDPARGLVRGPAGETRLEPKVMDVLCALAGRRGEVVTREELIETIWKVEYGGDESLTRAISILRRALGDPRVIETLPKRGYRFTAAVTPVRAEAHEHGGAGEDAPAAPVAGTVPARLRRAWPALIAVIAFAGVLGAAVFFARDAEVARVFAPDGRVEVRAFDVIAEGADARRFGAGLRDSMIRVLTVSGIETVSSTPSEPVAAGQSEFVLTGSVDRDGERYLVTVHFEERKGGLTLWSSQFERGLDETIALQNQLATRVTGVLRCGLAFRAPHIGEMTSEVFSLFLQACASFGGFDGGDALVSAHALARRIVDVAPNLAESHGFFAVTSADMANVVSPAEADAYLAAAREAAARALELDPDTGLAYHALAAATPSVPQRWAEKEAYLRKIKPGDMSYPYALVGLVWLARGSGHVDEAIELQRRAAALDPFSPFHAGVLAWLLANKGELRQADALIARADSLWPNATALKDYGLQIAAWRKPPDIAERMLSEPAALCEGTTEADIVCTRAILEVRRRGTMGASADAFRGSDCFHTRRNEMLARLLSSVGDVDRAYRELERIDFESFFGSTIFLFFPEMRAVRRDPRFMPLAAQVGLVDYWLKTDRWPDFCAEPDLPYDCREVAQSLQTADKTHSAAATPE